MLRPMCGFALLLSLVTTVGAQQTIYWKKDHIYVGGKEVAIVTPAPSDQTAPTAPSSLGSSQVTAVSVQLSWTGSTDSGGSNLAGYKVYRGLLPVATVGPGALTFKDEPLRPSTNYAYTIVAFDHAQNHSAASNSVAVTTSSASGETTAPSIPTNLQAHAPIFNKVQLRWFASTDAGGSGLAGYKVYRGGHLISGANPIPEPEYTDTTVAGGLAYSYTVTAIDNAENVSAATGAADVTTPFELLFEDNFDRPNAGSIDWPSGEGGFYIWNMGAYCNIWWDDPEVPRACESTRGASYGNVRLSAQTSDAQLLFWSQTSPNEYRVRYAWTTLQLSFGSTPLAQASVGTGGVLTVEAFSSTGRIKIYIDGVLKIDFTDPVTTRPRTGDVGIRSSVEGERTDNFRIYRLN